MNKICWLKFITYNNLKIHVKNSKINEELVKDTGKIIDISKQSPLVNTEQIQLFLVREK